ncbi:unnamed protein product [Owenia fusiformis]|uniref:Uncharacterized protein n=1 Tax=Owenia fusiformis TaxID=6347 RepID=A0A8J1Y288_OWEFU|nr:unnamed protein product [Owenia fusiformis]
MIADTGLLSNSSWGLHSDNLLSKEVYHGIGNTQPLDLDILELENELERVKSENEKAFEIHHITSTGTSKASSECSEDLHCGELDSGLGLSMHDTSESFLNQSILSVLDEGVPDPLDFEWSDLQLDSQISSNVNWLSDSQSDILPVTTPLCTPTKRPRSNSVSRHKTWCEMTNSEQIREVEELSRTISEDLGLREQLEVIQIINPRATISYLDTEFVIDLDDIDDEKLQRVRDFVRIHTSCNTPISSGASDTSSNCSSPHPKKLTKKQRQAMRKEMRQRQRKEYRQMMREKKSGLFAKEEVLALRHHENDANDDDVDIE